MKNSLIKDAECGYRATCLIRDAEGCANGHCKNSGHDDAYWEKVQDDWIERNHREIMSEEHFNG